MSFELREGRSRYAKISLVQRSTSTCQFSLKVSIKVGIGDYEGDLLFFNIFNSATII